MNLALAITTSTSRVGVALGDPEQTLASLHLVAERRHCESLAPALQSLSDLSGVELASVERIAIDVGPGLFTGLRAGIATAKALGSALGVPLVGVSSLDLLADGLRHAGDRTIAAVVDARRGEVFWGLYLAEPGGARTLGEHVATAPSVLAETLSSLSAAPLAAGDGARRYARELEAAGAELAGTEHDHPSAGALLSLAWSRPAVPPAQLKPEYLRQPDVRVGWEQRDG